MSEKENLPGSPEKTGNKPAEPVKKEGNNRRRIGLILLLLILAGAITGAWMWYKSKIELTTDDAFIESHIHFISARIPGQVAEIPVTDNQQVASGDLLVALDPAVYRTQVARAEASLAQARNITGEDQGDAQAAKAAVAQAKARLEQAERDLLRGEALFGRDVIPKERLEQLKTAHQVASASLEQVRQKLRAANAKVGARVASGEQAQVAERAAELEQARLNLSYTRITAPVAGYVTRKTVQLGQNIQAGQPLLALVELEQPWIIANYKESQLNHLEKGQRVEFSVDAYPGQTFTGRVESIMAGTGSAFSMLPPENATGNYVKVVQRVPVKITIDPDSDRQHLLRVGMSVVPTIFTGRSLGDIIGHLNPFH